MSIKLENYSSNLDDSGDAHASVTVIVVDADGVTELGREEVRTRVNADLRADDEKRRGMRVDARDRMKQKLAERIHDAEARILKRAAKQAEADAVFGDLLAELQAEVTP